MQFSFTLTDEQDGVSRDFLELSVQCVTARADQRSEELRCDLVVTSITLRDHTMYHDGEIAAQWRFYVGIHSSHV